MIKLPLDINYLGEIIELNEDISINLSTHHTYFHLVILKEALSLYELVSTDIKIDIEATDEYIETLGGLWQLKVLLNSNKNILTRLSRRYNIEGIDGNMFTLARKLYKDLYAPLGDCLDEKYILDNAYYKFYRGEVLNNKYMVKPNDEPVSSPVASDFKSYSLAVDLYAAQTKVAVELYLALTAPDMRELDPTTVSRLNAFADKLQSMLVGYLDDAGILNRLIDHINRHFKPKPLSAKERALGSGIRIL